MLCCPCSVVVCHMLLKYAQIKVVFPSTGFCFAFSSYMREVVLISLRFRVVCGVEGQECALGARF